MKNYTQSDYALNKNAAGIIYPFADQTVEVTLEDYLRENPDKTPADFAVLKALSDEDYYDTDRADYRQSWKNISFNRLTEEELNTLCTPSAEQSVIERDADEAAYAKRQSTAALALDKLTEVQRRRYLLHHAHGKSVREIAELEGAFFTSVHESLKSAEKKIKKILAEG